MKRSLKILIVIAVAGTATLALAVATRGYWLPERFAINVPLGSIVGAAPNVPPSGVVASLRLPPGFTLTQFATGLGNARFLRVTDAGDVIVSQPRESRVTLLIGDANGDGASDGTVPLLEGLDRPHGLALRDGFLYVAEMTAVGRIAFDTVTRKTTGTFERVITDLPGGGNHWTRTIGFGPDGFLYVSVGSSCNVCIESDARRAAISRYDPGTWRGTVFASGLRNSVGFAWRTVAGATGANHELLATDNGRDLLGNDFPPCELNHVVEGGFYGWPFANGDRVKDPDLGQGRDREITASRAPVHNFPAHNAPLGIGFLESPLTPAAYRGAALVALHGSWNRTTKDGYKVVSLHWDAQSGITERDFLTGFLNGENVIGRPVDIAQAADGSIYISDDFGGSIYRVTVSDQIAASPSTAGASGPVSGQGAGSSPPVLDAAAAERGQAVWKENQCDMCHDPAQVGKDPDLPIRVLEKLGAKYDVARLVTYLQAPQPPMPLFEMTAGQRRDLSTYVLKRFR
jgi:glucose/arabinose dehydrogenase